MLLDMSPFFGPLIQSAYSKLLLTFLSTANLIPKLKKNKRKSMLRYIYIFTKTLFVMIFFLKKKIMSYYDIMIPRIRRIPS